ncbi:MAG TPA: hypothetical protein VFU22_08010 [Roseiflexaceae bacterium]|nr:hypothetical protein [Roseiflexaceae bacterium]
MGKADRILGLMPAFYRATDQAKLLYEIAYQLAQPLEEADTHLFRIQRAHRLNVAERVEDIVRLAATLNLTAYHFEDILAQRELDYVEKLALMRERVKRIARIHLVGLATPWAIMEAVATFLNAAIVPDHPGDPLIQHVDADGYSHRATIEFDVLPEKRREQIYLHESPLRRQQVEPAGRWRLSSWAIANRNAEASPVRLAIQGVGERTILPSVFCPDTGEGIVFNGIVPDGKVLLIDDGRGATIEDEPVNEWLISFKGGIADFGALDSAPFVIEQGEVSPPFDGDFERMPPRPFQVRRPVPAARVGHSAWYFNVREGCYDGVTFDYAVYAMHNEPIGAYDHDCSFDACLFDYPASGVVGMAWDERIPCAFKLLLPAEVPALRRTTAAAAGADIARAGTADGPAINYVGRIGTILPGFKAAGIRAFVDTGKDAWVLGQSVIRDLEAAEGEGATFHKTQLLHPQADIFVPLDT